MMKTPFKAIKTAVADIFFFVLAVAIFTVIDLVDPDFGAHE